MPTLVEWITEQGDKQRLFDTAMSGSKEFYLQTKIEGKWTTIEKVGISFVRSSDLL